MTKIKALESGDVPARRFAESSDAMDKTRADQSQGAWEITLIFFLLAVVKNCDARIKYFEEEDRRKAFEIDHLQRALGQRRRAA